MKKLIKAISVLAVTLPAACSWAAERVWTAPIAAPIAYDSSGAPAPVEVMWNLAPRKNEWLRSNVLDVRPLGDNLTLYSAQIKRADGEETSAFGLQLRSPNGRLLANHIETFDGPVANALKYEPKGYITDLMATSPDGGAWVAAVVNDGTRHQCKLFKYTPNLVKTATWNCPLDLPEQSIRDIIPLSNTLALVQFGATARNVLLNHRGAMKELAQPLGNVIASQRLLNGNTMLLAMQEYVDAENADTFLIEMSPTGTAVSKTRLLNGDGQPLRAYEHELHLMSADALLVVSHPTDGRSSGYYWDYISSNGETIFTKYNLKTRTTQWSRTLNAYVDVDVSRGKVFAFGVSSMEAEPQSAVLFEMSSNGDLKSTPVEIASSPYLMVYAGFRYVLSHAMLSAKISNLTVNPNGSMTLLSYFSEFDGPLEENPSIKEYGAVLTLDMQGKLLKSSTMPGLYVDIQSDVFNRVYAVRDRSMLKAGSFNFSDPNGVFVDKINSK